MIGFVARAISFAGALALIGATAFSYLVGKRSQRQEFTFPSIVRGAGALLVGGAGLELLSVAIAGNASLVLSGSLAVAIGARLLAGLLALPGLQTSVAASALALGSFSFDGHTVTKGNRLVTAVVDAAHVAAAGVWVGGLICLVLIAYRGSTRDLVVAATWFRSIAMVAVVVVGATGAALTATIIDAFGDLWNTAWGQLLVAKVVLVAVAAVAGAGNHFVLVPRAAAAAVERTQGLRRTVVFEVVVLWAAVGVAAALVAAAT